MVDGELVGPGGEPREPAEVVETPEHGEQRVGGGLLRDVVEIPAKVRVRRPPAAGLESGGTEEQRVKPLHGLLPNRSVATEPVEPVAGLGIEQRGCRGRPNDLPPGDTFHGTKDRSQRAAHRPWVPRGRQRNLAENCVTSPSLSMSAMPSACRWIAS
jgi:hypothetical protein